MLRCDKCDTRAVYHRRYSGQKFCEKHFVGYFEEKIRRTIRKGRMLRRGDVVAVGVSGGKDSLTTLHLLSKMTESLDLGLHAIAVDEGVEGYRKKTLAAVEAFCTARGVPLMVASFEESYGFSLDNILSDGRSNACTYCGVLRRKLLNDKALELGADALATGHNLDDEAQAIMMNYISGDVARVVRYASDSEAAGLVRRIKPLCEMPEKEVALYALMMNLGASFEECPYAGGSRRTLVRSWLNSLEEGSPGVKYSILQGYRKLLPYLTQFEQKGLKHCLKCGEASAGEICKACSLIEGIKA